MAAIIGSIGTFDESIEQWSSYTERFGYFAVANGITDEKLVPTFLSIMGPKTFNLLRDLLQPVKPGKKNSGYTDKPPFTQTPGNCRKIQISQTLPGRG